MAEEGLTQKRGEEGGRQNAERRPQASRIITDEIAIPTESYICNHKSVFTLK